jgi:hypothetical protein
LATIHLFSFILIHNFFDAPLHHSKILLRINSFSLRLILHIVNFLYVALLLLVTLKTIIETRWRTGGLVEQGL